MGANGSHLLRTCRQRRRLTVARSRRSESKKPLAAIGPSRSEQLLAESEELKAEIKKRQSQVLVLLVLSICHICLIHYRAWTKVNAMRRIVNAKTFFKINIHSVFFQSLSDCFIPFARLSPGPGRTCSSRALSGIARWSPRRPCLRWKTMEWKHFQTIGTTDLASNMPLYILYHISIFLM